MTVDSTYLERPARFLDALVARLDLSPPLTGFCANYELREWRCKQLAGYLVEWLPEFALSRREYRQFQGSNAVRMLARAAHVVYTTDKYGRRGEFGELLLHAILREEFQTEPAISKLYYKDSSNDTVKGFDAVHVVAAGEDFELWLGEAKLYADIGQAISAVVSELEAHAARDYLRGEFVLIANKIDPDWPHAERFKSLIDRNVPLEEIFTSLRIPVLLTYDSETVAAHDERTQDYIDAFSHEVLAIRDVFANKALPANLAVHLLLVPLASKAELVDELNARLVALQRAVA